MKLRFPLFSPEGEAPAGGGAGGTTILAAAGGSGQQQQHQGEAGGGGGGSSWSWAKEDGTFSDGWQDKLEGDLKGHASLLSIRSLPDLAKSYVHTKGMLGKKLEMPGEGATPEQIANWRKVTGAPEKPEGYRGDAKSLRPETLPDDIWSAETEEKFLGIAHKHHLPPAAVKEILSFYGETVTEGLKQGQHEEAETVKAETLKLRQTWGKDFDANLTAAATVARTVGLDPTTDPIFTNARAVEAFAQMAKLVSGDKLVAGETPNLGASISERIKEITDPKSTSMLAREYRGEFGNERQLAAQKQYHQLLESQAPKK